MIQAELDKVMSDMERKLVREGCQGVPAFTRLPSQGLCRGELEELLSLHASMDKADVAGGRVSGTVYGMDASLREVMLMAFSRFFYTNPLHPDVFRSIRKMEAEVVAMTLAMFGGAGKSSLAKSDESDTDDVVELASSPCGVLTSGGTESILLACKAYRDQARQERGILFPELIVPVTAHAAFEKAAAYFGIRLIPVAVAEHTGVVDLKQMRHLITSNTIALVASAPNFALGTLDDVPGIAALAAEHEIGCHVDCCLGSFLLPHLLQANHLSPVDFRLPGVTSISCDPHKYGFGPKGTSVIMYRSAHLRHYQYFVSTGWTGGIYATPTLLGSRSGAITAATWVALLATGEAGYREAALQIHARVRSIVAGISSTIPELFVYGEPVSSVVAFGSTNLNVYAINDAMSKAGWHLNALQNPPAIHMACTLLTSEETVQSFLKDLRQAVDWVKGQPLLNLTGTGTAAIYGTTAVLPDQTIVEDVAKGYIDILYRT